MLLTRFHCAFHEETRTLCAIGDVDTTAALELRSLLLLHADEDGPLTLDLSLVDSLSGAAVGVIAGARAEMRARFLPLALVAAPDTAARRLLAESGMHVLEA